MQWFQAKIDMVFLLCLVTGLTTLCLGLVTGLLIGRRIFQKQQATSLKERQQAEVAQQQSEAKFRRLVESNVIGVVVANINGTIFEANDAFLEMVRVHPSRSQGWADELGRNDSDRICVARSASSRRTEN
jgi:PAS domain-containing protein